MKFVWLVLLSLVFSLPTWADEEDQEEDYTIVILTHGEEEFHLHSLTQEGFLPNYSEKLSPKEMVYRLKVSLNEKDDSLKELTIKIGGKNYSFDPSQLSNPEDIDLNTFKINPSGEQYVGGVWNWNIIIEMQSGPLLENCSWEEDFGLTHLKYKYLITIILNTKEEFNVYFNDYSENCHEK